MQTPYQPHRKPGLFISLEGIEGTGKTTQASGLAERLKSKGFTVLLTQEPGGTVIGNRIREILLLPEHDEMDFMTELLLYNAARTQLLSEKILPELQRGTIVITDRFSDSTVAYQGYGRGIDLWVITALDKISTGAMKPDLTLLFDLDVETGLRRNRQIEKVDRLELEEIGFHRRVMEGFRKLAEGEPGRIRVVDASLPLETVKEMAWNIVSEEMKKRGMF